MYFFYIQNSPPKIVNFQCKVKYENNYKILRTNHENLTDLHFNFQVEKKI